MSTPEWSIFDRLDELENITLKLMEQTDTAEPTLKKTSATARDARILALNAFAWAFFASAIKSPNPTALKDAAIDSLKPAQLSPEILESLEEILIKICDILEKAKVSK